jgi:hypothetical protein
MPQDANYLDVIFNIDKRFENHYFEVHHLEDVRKLDFLLLKEPHNSFYHSLKAQSWRNFFSSEQKKCIDEDFWKYNMDIIYIRKKKKGSRKKGKKKWNKKKGK